jgi:hypothetical protein
MAIAIRAATASWKNLRIAAFNARTAGYEGPGFIA